MIKYIFNSFLLATSLILLIFKSVSACELHKNMNDANYSKRQILLTYGANNLSAKPPFQGGYINFGYWKNINIDQISNSKITQEQRVQASLELYRLVFEHLAVDKNDSILEVGSGLGYGGRYLRGNYTFNQLTCIDLTPQYITGAKQLDVSTVNDKPIEFLVADAEDLSALNKKFDKIYSVEVAQYFTSMDKFASEAFKSLSPKGKLVLVAHFSTNDQGYEKTKELIPTVADNIDRMIPIDQVRQAFAKAGFKNIKIQSIGEFVFKGFDRWISQVEDEPWAHNIYKLYQDGHIDYYLLEMQKP